jgi:FkbM family methyltransferase
VNVLNALSRLTTATLAGGVSRLLPALNARATKAFYFWYRVRAVRHPNWVAPIKWAPTVRLRNGLRFCAPFTEVHGMSVTLTREYEPELAQRIESHLRPGDWFVDVGANMGYFTLLAAKIVGRDGLVVAFEPSPGNLNLLTQNIALNEVSNVLVVASALGDETGLMRLTVPPFYNNGVSTLRASQNGAATTPAWVQRFEDVPVLAAERERIALVKIDTEGLEPNVLRGMSNFLNGSSPRLAIACELSPEWYDVKELLKNLAAMGFTGEYFVDGKWQILDAELPPRVQCNAWFTRNAN